MSKVKRLFWDIETSPDVALVFRTGFNLTVNHDAIVAERKIICIAYSWEDEDKVTVLRWDHNQDDRQMLEQFLAVANEADELVAHYGNHFDLPWFRTRCLFHRFAPIPIYKTIDTKALASRYFYFNSDKLDYISKFLGYGGKIKTDFDLWKDVVWNRSQTALNKMCRYCGMDVVRLKQVYLRLAGYIPSKTHAGVLAGGAKWTCPHCASHDVTRDKKRATAAGTVQHQMRCRACDHYYTISERSYVDFLERQK